MLHPECRSCGECKHRTSPKRSKNAEYLVCKKNKSIELPNETSHLLMVMKGSVVVRPRGPKELVCSCGDMFLVLAHKNYLVTALEDTEVIAMTFENVTFVCDNDNADIRSVINSVNYEYGSLKMVPEVFEFAESFKHYLQDHIDCYYMNVSKHIEAFVLFRHYYSINDICNFFYPVIHKETSFYNLVVANYTSTCTATELAQACGYRSSNFRRLFKIHFGESPYQWLLKQKAPLIRQKLMDTTIPVKLIVAEFGFSDQSHLNSYCKRFFNQTPIEVRKGTKMLS